MAKRRARDVNMEVAGQLYDLIRNSLLDVTYIGPASERGRREFRPSVF